MKAALVVAALMTPAAAGPCLVDGLAPQVITPSGSVIDQYGGVVVAAVSTPMQPGADPSAQSSWRFRVGTKRRKTKITKLAPGLALYALSAHEHGLGVRMALEDTKDHTAVEVELGFMATRAMPVDPAPKVTAITHTTNGPMMRESQTVATLSAPPPAGTVALLVYSGKGDRKLARSFVLVPDLKTTSLTIYGHHRCEAEVPGTVPTHAGETVRLAWVDAGGHVSLLTEPITVTKR